MTLTWKPEFVLDQPQVDATHREFVELVGRLDESAGALADAALIERFSQLVDHTIEHFGQEDRWMAATGFTPDNCHTRQHQMVLDVMHEVLRLARTEGHLEPLRRIVAELEAWFPQHADMMDAALVFHMNEVGFDPARPEAGAAKLPAAALSGCGNASCS